MPLNIPTLKRKPDGEEEVLTKQRNEAMLHMARLAHERMKRIDEEDHERGMKEQQYNNSVKYQRMVEYELNNPGETATGILEYEAIFRRSRGRRVKRRLLREAVANQEMEHVPRSLRPKKHVLRKPDPRKIVYNRFTPAVQREAIERELKSKSTLTDIVIGMMSRSKSRGKKAAAQERSRELEWKRGSVDFLERPLEEDYGTSSYPNFGDYELGDGRYNSFPQMQGNARPWINEVYEEYPDRKISATIGQPQYGHGYPGGRSSFAYGEGAYGGGSVGYDERRRFSAPVPNYGPYPGFQPQYREATSLPDVRKGASVEEQIEELLEAMERSSLADSDLSGSLDAVSEEVEGQLEDMKAEKRRAGEVGDAVVECVALEDLPPVVQTIAIAREDARLAFEAEMGYEIEEIEAVAPMLVDLFELAKVLTQEAL